MNKIQRWTNFFCDNNKLAQTLWSTNVCVPNTRQVQAGLDVKVENFKAEKVLDHFRGCVFKAEWLVGC